MTCRSLISVNMMPTLGAAIKQIAESDPSVLTDKQQEDEAHYTCLFGWAFGLGLGCFLASDAQKSQALAATLLEALRAAQRLSLNVLNVLNVLSTSRKLTQQE